ncbi:hypothetical protein [Microcoleus sp. SVA1_A1]|uniref:hypothetical protein n=1 Tax=Microcoleus sp. SVA1_A1 TaxID=2818946 RepID=UPI002FD4C350
MGNRSATSYSFITTVKFKFKIFQLASQSIWDLGFGIYIKSRSIGINILPTTRTRQCRVPTINRGRETALPCPLYHSGATGIDITRNLSQKCVFGMPIALLATVAINLPICTQKISDRQSQISNC